MTLSDNDAILYALSIGFSKDPMNKDHYRYTYENDPDFAPFPMCSIIVCHRGAFGEGNYDVEGIPHFNPMMLVYAEEEVEFVRPIKQNTKYAIQDKMKDYQDKKKGALMVFSIEIREADTNQIATVVTSSLYIRGQGGFGYKGTHKSPIPKLLPDRAPDVVLEEKVNEN